MTTNIQMSTTESSSLRDIWIKSGWARGAFIDLKNTSNSFIFEHLPSPINEKVCTSDIAYLIPLTYDCALLDEDYYREPWAQYLICWNIDAKPEFKFGKHPRTYHFDVYQESTIINLEATALSFGHINREILMRCSVDIILKWPENGLKRCLQWCASRILQDVFPDTWNSRLSPKRKRFDTIWKSKNFNEDIVCVYINLSDEIELKPEETYSIKIILGVVDTIKGRDFANFEKQRGNEYKEQIKTIFSTINGVKIEAIEVLSESQITRSIEKNYKRWNLEYFSNKTTPEGVL